MMHFAGLGETALEKLTDGIEPTLIVILCDINMPGMDGLALLRPTAMLVARRASGYCRR